MKLKTTKAVSVSQLAG